MLMNGGFLTSDMLCVCLCVCSHALSDGALGGWGPVQEQSQNRNQRE